MTTIVSVGVLFSEDESLHGWQTVLKNVYGIARFTPTGLNGYRSFDGIFHFVTFNTFCSKNNK